ncbi:hypothetical protein Tco_0162773 [Tanacetum coccineum]
MDSMIPIGQKNTLAEYMILSGADNRPPMLDKDLTKKYAELSATKKIQVDCDLKATNIILQGLPSDIYSLVNHHRVAKDLWERIQLLMQGTSLTKQERECKLYDAFDKFAHIKGESLHQYYLRFTQLINDMNIYKMKLEQFQVNTKFLNSLPPEWNSGLAVSVFKQGDDPIDVINKMMSFLSTIITSRFPSNNNQLRNSSNPRQQVTIHNGRVTVQPVQGRQTSFAAGHMARQCLKPKSKRDATWFRDKVLQVEAQGNGKVLNEEELEFLADPGVIEGSSMANLSSYGSDVLSEVPHSENTHTDMLNQSVQEMSYSEQTYLVNYLENEITSDSNIIPYSQYLLETQNAAVQDTNYSAQQDAIILSVFEQLSNQITNCNNVNKDNLIANESLYAEIKRYKEHFMDFEKEFNYLKQTISKQSKEKELLTKTFNVFKNESKEKEAKNIDKEIALEKKVNELENIVCKMGQSAQTVHMLTKPQVFYYNNLKQALGFQYPFYIKKAQQIRPMLYDDRVIAKETNVISIANSEETLMLEEEIRSKMLLKK